MTLEAFCVESGRPLEELAATGDAEFGRPSPRAPGTVRRRAAECLGPTLSMLVGKPRDSPLGSTFDVGLRGMRSTGEVRHRRPRSHVLGIATELLEPERPVGSAEDVDTSKPVRGLPAGKNKPARIKARGQE